MAGYANQGGQLYFLLTRLRLVNDLIFAYSTVTKPLQDQIKKEKLQ